MSISPGSVTPTFRSEKKIPGTLAAVKEWSPLHLRVLSERSRSSTKPTADSQETLKPGL